MKKIFCLFLIFYNNTFSQELMSSLESIKNEIKNGNYTQRLQYLLKYEDDIPKNPIISYYIGICCFKLNNYEEAKKYFELCIKYNYITTEVNYNYGITLYKLKNYTESIKYLEKTKNDIFLGDNSLYILVSCYLRLNKKDKAIYSYRLLLEKYPNSLYVLKSQELFNKSGIDYTKFSVTLLKKSFYIDSSYGKDTNIGFITPDTYEDISKFTDFYFRYKLNLSLYTDKFFSYYSYSGKKHISYENEEYNYSLHSCVLRINIYNLNLAKIHSRLGLLYYEYGEPYNYNISGMANIEIPFTNYDLTLSLSTNKSEHFSVKQSYLDNIQYILGFSLGYKDSKSSLSFILNYKNKKAESLFNSTEYNYSYFILVGTNSFLNNVYTPVIKSYSYDSFLGSLNFYFKIFNKIDINLGVNLEQNRYFPKYEYYTKINDYYLYDVDEQQWFIYTEDGWTESLPPQLEKVIKQRIDTNISLVPSLKIKLNKDVGIELSYTYTKNSSTISSYSWEKEVYEVTVNIYLF
ncbi:MAG: tetratricopeptide repeat protein [Endomicrobia bacterium]|nr:tetratricopeptide repeat protein [Endomicrobiia bacterium]